MVTFLVDSPYIDSCLNLSTTVTFLVDSPYINSCLNLSTTATFFCPQGGRCGEVQLYYSCQSNTQQPRFTILFLGVVGSLLFCAVGIKNVFLIFCITLFGNYTCLQYQENCQIFPEELVNNTMWFWIQMVLDCASFKVKFHGNQSKQPLLVNDQAS